MKIWIVLPALAVGVLLLALVARQVAPRGDAPPLRPATSSEQVAAGYPPEVEATFRRDFSNLPPAVGECVLRQTEARYTYAEFQALVRQYGGTGAMAPDVRAFVTACTLANR